MYRRFQNERTVRAEFAEKVVEIEIERLHDFKNHPFKVQADSQIHAG